MLGGDVLHEVELVMVMRIDATIVTLPRRRRLESISFFHEISRFSAAIRVRWNTLYMKRVEVPVTASGICRVPEQSRVRVWGGLFDKT
jgi:hypothetical protein